MSSLTVSREKIPRTGGPLLASKPSGGNWRWTN